ncbi:Uma2 family endonuclease [Candidatus Parabeggiatoa sp. HSG14]|uniref:Uma2 family endonuclease n=1 Tax=Candidatus Parabeggiatoa sp. HSG14 TaxID=3055593 RepID=UPI0025A9248F|nr:Uma2 family endonuclease [Thiotrichales bacterium HSG14]
MHAHLLEKPFIPQTLQPRSPKETLPTMYDLPSENQEESGLPDDFHYFQPQLLRETFQPPDYSSDQVYVASDLNLYYDVHKPHWYKRPDWFAAVGVPRLYEGQELRMSYVIWQEGVAPYVVVELLSESTEKEDLGQIVREINKPPTKWRVYEQILRVPYYIVFSRDEDKFRIFQLIGWRYHELEIPENRLWISEIKLGIGLWSGNYQKITHKWLRWYDEQNNWLPTTFEKQQKAEQRAERLATQLRVLGIEPEV